MAPPIKKFKKNTAGTDYAVGDIHGCFEALENALAEIGFNPATDRLFATGDLCDRGPYSHRVLDWLDKPWFHPVRGNHEEMLFLHDRGLVDESFMRKAGASWWLEVVKADGAFKKKVMKKYEALPMTIEVDMGDEGKIGILHAECPHADWSRVENLLTGPFKQKFLAVCTWGAGSLTATTPVKGLKALIVGHMAQPNVIRVGNTIVLDTGAGYPGRNLTILKLSTLEVVWQGVGTDGPGAV